MPRYKNHNWDVVGELGHNHPTESLAAASLAVLMDIRDELQTLNANFRRVPRVLDSIANNTKRKRRRASTTRKPGGKRRAAS